MVPLAPPPGCVELADVAAAFSAGRATPEGLRAAEEEVAVEVVLVEGASVPCRRARGRRRGDEGVNTTLEDQMLVSFCCTSLGRFKMKCPICFDEQRPRWTLLVVQM